MFRALDGGGASVDSGRVHQYQYGAISSLCRRPFARSAADPRLRNAESIYRPGGGNRIGVAVAARECLSLALIVGGGTCRPRDGTTFFLYRFGRVPWSSP